jgi:hypothetical protein
MLLGMTNCRSLPTCLRLAVYKEPLTLNVKGNMASESSREGKYRLSVKGVLKYLTLWVAIFAVVRVLAEYSSIGADGPYPYSAGLVTEFLLPVTIGLVSVGVGVAVAYSFGAIKHVRAIAVWCFVIGCLSLPMLWVGVVVLAGLGLLSLD